MSVTPPTKQACFPPRQHLGDRTMAHHFEDRAWSVNKNVEWCVNESVPEPPPPSDLLNDDVPRDSDSDACPEHPS